MKRRSGVAMLLALWAAILLTGLLLPFLDDVSDHYRLAQRELDQLAAELAARAGYERAIAELAADDPGVDSDKDSWCVGAKVATSRMPAGRADSRQRYSLLAGGTRGGKKEVFGVIDEDRKVNVLKAPLEVLGRCPGMTPALLTQLAALRGGEQDLSSVRSLLGLPAMSPLLFFGEDWNEDGILQDNEDDGDKSPPADDHDGSLRTGLRALLTVHGDGRLNVNTASVEALATQTMITREHAARIVEGRSRAPGGYRTVEAALAAAKLPRSAAAGLKTASETFSIVSRGELVGSPAVAYVRAVVRRAAGRVETISYREGNR